MVQIKGTGEPNNVQPSHNIPSDYAPLPGDPVAVFQANPGQLGTVGKLPPTPPMFTPGKAGK
jgi:hypothetical protein